MDISPILTYDDYKTALKTVSALIELDPDIDTPEGKRLDMMTNLIETYENNLFSIGISDAI